MNNTPHFHSFLAVLGVAIFLIIAAQVIESFRPDLIGFDCKLQRIAYHTVGHVPQCEKDAIAAQKEWSSKK